jgi:hypothetical protein
MSLVHAKVRKRKKRTEVMKIACGIVESGHEAAQAVNIYPEELFPAPFKSLTL